MLISSISSITRRRSHRSMFAVFGKGERFLKGGTHTNKLGIGLLCGSMGVGVGMRFFGAAIECGLDFRDGSAALKTECFKGTFAIATKVTRKVVLVCW